MPLLAGSLVYRIRYGSREGLNFHYVPVNLLKERQATIHVTAVARSHFERPDPTLKVIGNAMDIALKVISLGHHSSRLAYAL
jgi:hypothetical protein